MVDVDRSRGSLSVLKAHISAVLRGTSCRMKPESSWYRAIQGRLNMNTEQGVLPKNVYIVLVPPSPLGHSRLVDTEPRLSLSVYLIETHQRTLV